MLPFPKYKISMLVAVLAMVVGTSWAVAAQPSRFDLKHLYFRALHGDSGAFLSLRHTAVDGDPLAQCLLGGYYFSHHNGKAFTWLTKAIAGHVVLARHTPETWLGLCYFQGVGTKQDFIMAGKWLHLAANGGNALAQYYLGMIYRYGNGVPPNSSQALHWFKKAAGDGNSAIGKAARKQIFPIVVTQAATDFRDDHYNKAFADVESAAAHGYAPAEYLMGNFYAARHAPNMSGKITPLSPLRVKQLLQTASAGAEALKRLKTAADGNANAAFAMGLWYEHHLELKQAISWIGGAAHWGVVPDIGAKADPAAQFELARLFMSGSFENMPIPESPVYARKQVRMLLMRSALHDNVNAEFVLGFLYYWGNGTQYRISPSRKKAKYWLTKAAAQGDKRAATLLNDLRHGGGAKTITIGQ